jgi:hypothetical protein
MDSASVARSPTRCAADRARPLQHAPGSRWYKYGPHMAARMKPAFVREPVALSLGAWRAPFVGKSLDRGKAREDAERLASFRDTLLPKQMSGELRVHAAERAMGALT